MSPQFVTDGPRGPRHENLLFRLGMLWGHYAARVVPAFYAVALGFASIRWWGVDLPQALEIPRFLVGPALGITMLVETYVHDRHLCLRHIQEAPLLDPQAAVGRKMRSLRFYHRRWLRFAALVVAGLPLVTNLPRPGATPVYVRIVVVSLAAVCIAVGVWVMRVHVVHRGLTAWCPWCRDDGGADDPEVVPTPDPAGVANR